MENCLWQSTSSYLFQRRYWFIETFSPASSCYLSRFTRVFADHRKLHSLLHSSLRSNMSIPIRSHFSFYTQFNYIMLCCSKPLLDTNAHQHVFKDHLLFDQFSRDQSPAIKMEISAASPLCLLWSAKQVLRSHMKSEFFNWQSSSGWRC